MQRIGIAASHMSKGNVWRYNVFVVLLSSLVSLFIFVVIGSTILFSLLIMSYLARELGVSNMGRQDWTGVMGVCMLVLTVVVGIWNLIAISRNIRLKRPRFRDEK